jgi:transposase InsO family protein
MTYVWTREGWLYLAVVLDLHSRKVVGWSMSERMTTNLPLAALQIAYERRRPPPGLLHHSDRGSQYASRAYRLALDALGQ